MATQSQVKANQANAQRSTGPKTTAGKQRSAQNSRTHGFTAGFMGVTPEEQDEYNTLAGEIDLDLLPEGALEEATRDQIVDAAWRLRKLHKIHAQMAADTGTDPLIHPDSEAALKQLARYRASMEMAFYRALKTLRELQTRRAARVRHCNEAESVTLPPNVEPVVYAKSLWTRDERSEYLELHGRSGPDAIWELKTDEWQQSRWVRLPSTNRENANSPNRTQ